jgi:phosphopantetheinyl transferase (holo-ACP synthase)
MIVGIGTDFVEIDRLERLIGRHSGYACARSFTEREREYCLSRRHSGELARACSVLEGDANHAAAVTNGSRPAARDLSR